MWRRGMWKEMKLTEEFQEIPEGYSLPAGAYVRINLKTGKKEAKIEKKENRKPERAETTPVHKNKKDVERKKVDVADNVDATVDTDLPSIILNLREKRKKEKAQRQMLLGERGNDCIAEKTKMETSKRKRQEEKMNI